MMIRGPPRNKASSNLLAALENKRRYRQTWRKAVPPQGNTASRARRGVPAPCSALSTGLLTLYPRCRPLTKLPDMNL